MNNKPLREVFGESLTDLGAVNPKVVVLDADLSSATRSILFGNKFPERFFNMGITEANMVSTAVGLSTCGLIPYVCTFSFLLTLRATDQIRSQISYPANNVKLIGTNGGLSGFGDGATHQSIMDLAILRAMPNFKIIVPSDASSMKWAVQEVAGIEGPTFIRVPRVPAPEIHRPGTKFEIGKGLVLKKGKDVTIVAMGMMVSYALDAVKELTKEGIDAEVVEIHTIKPIDKDLLVESTSRTRAVVTVEEHNRYGGLFSAVLEALSLESPVPADWVAIDDHFGGSGQYDELLKVCGLTVDNIVKKAKRVIKIKEKTGYEQSV
ncbi:Transketolase, C-terminal section [hydrothermal vent metagenome]|uniref:Transketolase, C-terminal section n=1 Tax=hydrothermal vent metagenome TaxID=652676 RepID=A0A3B1CAT7_9ZZZZ